jgi:parvulin-like peptidyl-prolyl isomerase
MPEPLSGLPEKPEIEIAAGRPWLSVNELNRLIRQQGLSLAVAQAWVFDELAQAIALPPEEEKTLIRAFLEREGVKDDTGVAAWLESKRLSFDDLRIFATNQRRQQLFREHRWGEEAEVHFLARKLELDQVVYSLLRLADEGSAIEMHHRIQEGEADFADLAPQHSSGQERHTRGLIGPVPLAAAHPALVSRLRIGRPGKLWPPFQVGDLWLVVRFEQLLPAQLNEPTRARMVEELFQKWYGERVRLLMAGEPPPPHDRSTFAVLGWASAPVCPVRPAS